MTNDVWSSGSESDDRVDFGLGDVDYDAGQSVNQAFSVDNVVRLGLAVAQEQPALLCLGAGNLLALQLIAQFLGPMIQLPTVAAFSLAGVPAEAADALGQLASVFAQLALMPFQSLVMAGLLVAVARFVRSDEVSYASLYNQIGPMVQLVLYSLLVGFGMVLLVVVIGLPFGASIWGMIEAGLAPAAIIGISAVGGVLAMVCILYVSLGLHLGSYAVCLDGRGPLEALAVSWRVTAGARITLFVTLFCLSLAGLLGCCLCVLPGIFVQALGMAGLTAAWLQVARSEEEFGSYPFIQRNASF